MNAVSFKSVMEEVIISYYHSLSGNNIFQQDGARYYTASSVLFFLEGQGVEVMEWPPQFPNLNLIEAVWTMLDKITDKKMKDTHFYQDLERGVHEE